jgi:hypothetical protein
MNTFTELNLLRWKLLDLIRWLMWDKAMPPDECWGDDE